MLAFRLMIHPIGRPRQSCSDCRVLGKTRTIGQASPRARRRSKSIGAPGRKTRRSTGKKSSVIWGCAVSCCSLRSSHWSLVFGMRGSPSCPVFLQATGMGQRKRHKIRSWEAGAHGAADTRSLAEGRYSVGPACLAPEQRWNGMPAMRPK